jgi:hypothetical protein
MWRPRPGTRERWCEKPARNARILPLNGGRVSYFCNDPSHGQGTPASSSAVVNMNGRLCEHKIKAMPNRDATQCTARATTRSFGLCEKHSREVLGRPTSNLDHKTQEDEQVILAAIRSVRHPSPVFPGPGPTVPSSSSSSSSSSPSPFDGLLEAAQRQGPGVRLMINNLVGSLRSGTDVATALRQASQTSQGE